MEPPSLTWTASYAAAGRARRPAARTDRESIEMLLADRLDCESRLDMSALRVAGIVQLEAGLAYRRQNGEQFAFLVLCGSTVNPSPHGHPPPTRIALMGAERCEKRECVDCRRNSSKSCRRL